MGEVVGLVGLEVGDLVGEVVGGVVGRFVGETSVYNNPGLWPVFSQRDVPKSMMSR